jgi:hypothetical protein
VLEVTHGLHYYYSKGDLIGQKAVKVLGEEAKLVAIYFSSPLDQGYRFVSGEKEVVIDPFSLRILSEEELRVRLGSETMSTLDESLQSEIREEWDRLRER